MIRGVNRSIRVLATAASVAAGGAASAQTLHARYDVTLAGLSIGVASLSAQLDRDRYALELNAKVTGVATALSAGHGAATAAGSLGSGRPIASTFAVTASSGKQSRTIRMALSGGNVQASQIDPPPEPDDKTDRIPVTPAHKKGVVDPFGALVLPLAVPAKGSGLDPAGCNRTISIFDGATRFDVSLTYKDTRTISGNGYSGPVLVCAARYTPIAGHRPQRRITKWMAENRDMEAWLAPVGQRVLMPYRVAVRTLIGMTVIQASDFRVDEAAVAKAQPARPADKPRN